MLEAKLFELRDRGTFIPVLAIKLKGKGNGSINDKILERAGLNYPGSYSILLWDLNNNRGFVDCRDWPGAPMIRTFPVCHRHIEQCFDSLKHGSVIDIEYLMRETIIPKESEL